LLSGRSEPSRPNGNLHPTLLTPERRVAMIRSVVGAVAFGLLAATPALAIAPSCADQLAQIKAEMTSDVLAQSELGKKYEEANRLCVAGNDMKAQALAREIRQEMADKHASPDAR